jgi:outer membrane protein assembly factor BamA
MEKYWETSNLHIVEVSYTYKKRTRRFTHYLTPHLTHGTGDFDFTKISLRINEFIRTTWNNGFTAKVFAGYVTGTPPRQYRFYPSGSLFPTGESPFALTYEGTFSPLEHWHIEGGPDLKGYYGRDMSGTGALTVSLCTPYLLSRSWFPSTIFFDAGMLFDEGSDTGMLYDVGVTINIGPLFMDFPLWVSKPAADEKKLAFRWSIGLSPSSIALF